MIFFKHMSRKLQTWGIMCDIITISLFGYLNKTLKILGKPDTQICDLRKFIWSQQRNLEGK